MQRWLTSVTWLAWLPLRSKQIGSTLLALTCAEGVRFPAESASGCARWSPTDRSDYGITAETLNSMRMAMRKHPRHSHMFQVTSTRCSVSHSGPLRPSCHPARGLMEHRPLPQEDE
jgi:hypothetical protein